MNPYYDTKIAVTILDVETGEVRKHPIPASAAWWIDGSGSCDCNRRRPFVSDDEFWSADGVCDGTRYLVIDIDVTPKGMKKDGLIDEMNHGRRRT